MSTPDTSSRFSLASNSLRTFGKWLFLLLVCAYFACCYATHKSFLDLDRYTRGQAAVPYQYRVLPMYVLRLLLGIPIVPRIAAHVAPLGGSPYTFVLSIIAFAGLLGAMLATMGSIRVLTGDRIFAFWASFLIFAMAQLDLASSWFYSFVTPYDVPSLMFFAVAIYLILTRRWWLYYPVFLLAVLNRETACFITVFFAVWEYVRLREASERVIATLIHIAPSVALQAVAWFAIKVHLAHIYVRNPVETGAHAGGAFTMNLLYNLKELLKPQQWPVLLSVCGFSLPFLWLQRRWIRNRALSLSLAVTLPLSFAGFMMVGVIVEIRIFTEWIALVTPALALILWNRFRPVSSKHSRHKPG